MFSQGDIYTSPVLQNSLVASTRLLDLKRGVIDTKDLDFGGSLLDTDKVCGRKNINDEV